MKWFRMAGGMVTGVLAFANAPSAQGGNPEPIAVKQGKAEKSSKFEGRWIVVSGTVDGEILTQPSTPKGQSKPPAARVTWATNDGIFKSQLTAVSAEVPAATPEPGASNAPAPTRTPKPTKKPH